MNADRTLGRGWRRPDSILDLLVAVAAALAIGALALAALLRLRYPFELEWMEGGVLDHVRVVLAGEALYRRPSLAFTPFIYTPFYYWVCAALSPLLGVGLGVARLVSVASTAISLALIGDFVRRETGDRLAALAAAGWFAATYELTGFWLDVARVDSLFLALVLGGTWLARFGRGHPSALAAGAVLFLAFFTKQIGLVLAGPAVVFALTSRWRRGLVVVGTLGALLALALVGMNGSADGWFGFYTLAAPAQHDVLWGRWHGLLLEYLWSHVAVPVLLAILAFVSPALRARGFKVWTFYALLGALAAGTSYSSLLHRGGFVNVLIPAYAVLAMMSGFGWAWVRKETAPGRGGTPAAVRSFAATAVLLAFATLAYDLRRAIPAEADLAANRQMVATLQSVGGALLVPGGRLGGFLAGRGEIGAHTMALADVFRAGDRATQDRLREEMLRAIEEQRYQGIVLDRSWEMLPPEMAAAVRARYRLAGRLFPPSAEAAGWPRTGYRTRPEELWVPR